ncbi:hypothetical protein BDV93DRAFT_142519 [Ceratobasidium sp. AG-I]|nr:hypothetical protein BDV93DRAFT_142519 [Ceratobasidium sp. AG-I]
MILIDSQKFACSACINGHRSSSCQHTERPLFEIKKKGRPVTQCERCRELRKTRSYHSKCLCDKPDATSQKATEDDSVLSTDKTPGNKRKNVSRTTSGVPALPNGIRDIVDKNKPTDLEQKEQSRKRFKAMLNSCKCGCDNTKRCRCNGGDLLAPIQSQAEGGSCCGGKSGSAQPSKQGSPSRRLLPKPKISAPASGKEKELPQAPPAQSVPPTNSCCAAKVPPAERPSFQHRNSPIVIKPLSLPPDSAGPALLPSIATWTTPIPSLHKHTTTTMDSCGCGDGCACAGCVEHQGAVAAAAAIAAGHHSCPDRCGTCQDMSSANMEVTSLSGPSISDNSSIESLLARAIAKLPPPPPGKLSVFQSASGGDRVALVVLPRLSGARVSGGSSPSFGFASNNDTPSTPSSTSSAEASTNLPPLQAKRVKKSARFRRQIRSLSPSDDDLTDADAEGELDPENMDASPPPAPVASNSWALAQLDIDVELELELAADAIDGLR